jgi:hypothetical protein
MRTTLWGIDINVLGDRTGAACSTSIAFLGWESIEFCGASDATDAQRASTEPDGIASLFPRSVRTPPLPPSSGRHVGNYGEWSDGSAVLGDRTTLGIGLLGDDSWKRGDERRPSPRIDPR